mmetsp:Transcript_21157/g.46652  ORF Transcript_21157/g.46652 Transcript_21157/m.46652 type:complete len:272 (+) Transcript_21157:109-924(+)
MRVRHYSPRHAGSHRRLVLRLPHDVLSADRVDWRHRAASIWVDDHLRIWLTLQHEELLVVDVLLICHPRRRFVDNEGVAHYVDGLRLRPDQVLGGLRNSLTFYAVRPGRAVRLDHRDILGVLRQLHLGPRPHCRHFLPGLLCPLCLFANLGSDQCLLIGVLQGDPPQLDTPAICMPQKQHCLAPPVEDIEHPLVVFPGLGYGKLVARFRQSVPKVGNVDILIKSRHLPVELSEFVREQLVLDRDIEEDLLAVPVTRPQLAQALHPFLRRLV